ncbi:Spx/MgsR family RNA polymerase-binding regulatory protein [Fictibacillus aquaticus]|uniref:Transcriptional regulator n=1 Tax=Fictibacillus aquaticus TaxID=2021314 RepID=A0A235F977_9BACL|nr:Spx/MgsR family RNA polymerase-binding regulatory protein [Fictibacillus aquaticus]OYD57828.1 transcriptional regulator [Fictibacillus aquaticus]
MEDQKLIFFTYPSCTSCRKAKSWLKKNDVPFEERHLFRETPTIDELRDIMKMTKNGTEEILAKRSRSYQALNMDINDLTVNELLELLHENPRLLKRPLLTDGRRLVAGYSPGELSKLAKGIEKEHIFHVS